VCPAAPCAAGNNVANNTITTACSIAVTAAPPPRKVPLATVQKVLRLYREQYAGYNVAHFRDQLRQHHDIPLIYPLSMGQDRPANRRAGRASCPTRPSPSTPTTPTATRDDVVCGRQPFLSHVKGRWDDGQPLYSGEVSAVALAVLDAVGGGAWHGVCAVRERGSGGDLQRAARAGGGGRTAVADRATVAAVERCAMSGQAVRTVGWALVRAVRATRHRLVLSRRSGTGGDVKGAHAQREEKGRLTLRACVGVGR